MDIAKIAERLAELNSKSGKSGGMGFLKIEDGRNVVRILPPADENDMFYEEVFVHYNVGKTDEENGTMVVCPKTEGENKKCPVCELVAHFKKLSNKKGDKYDKMAGDLWKKKRVYYNAIAADEKLDDYKKDEEGKWVSKESGNAGSPVKVMGSGVGILKDLMNTIVDPEYGDVTDPETGLDIIITKSGTGMKTNYEVKTVRKDTPIRFAEWKECLNDLKSLIAHKTYAEIEEIMTGESKDEEEDTPDKDEPEVEVTHKHKEPDKAPVDEPDSEEDADDEIEKAIAARRARKNK